MSESLVSFWHRTDDRCEDCDLRNALTPLGTPKFSKVYGFGRAYGCAGCGGTGRQSYKVSVEAGPALELLTEKQRFVMRLRLRLVDDLRYKQREIARMMNTSRQAVAKHEALARKKIQQYIEGMTFYLRVVVSRWLPFP
jgi:hypothetical protein